MTTQPPTDPTLRASGQRSARRNGGNGHAAGTTPMTAASLEELRDELERLRRRAHRLTSAHQSLGPDVISAASPVGQALIGAVPGATVTVDLPNGRSRSMRLVAVETGSSATGPAGGPAWPM